MPGSKEKNSTTNAMRTEEQGSYEAIAEGCIECGLCQKSCLFLQKYGSPKEIAEQCLKSKELLRESFECSLCTLCTTVCPKDIDPAAMFSAMRRKGQSAGHGDFKEHKGLLSYEKWGVSPLFSWYGLPEGCDTVFFPGCAIAGSRSERVLEVYGMISKQIPSLGVVLDCCTKPSHDLGRVAFFHHSFGMLQKALAERGIKKVLVACPSCYRVWSDYGKNFEIKTVYEQLAGITSLAKVNREEVVTVHDPCPTRNDTEIHKAVRQLIEAMGVQIREMKHHGRKTVCCGEGGAACYVMPQYAENWTLLRMDEAQGDHVITYCAGCTNFLGRHGRADHILDLICEPDKTLTRTVTVTRSPFTWLKRLLLKRKLMYSVRPVLRGGRDSSGRVVLR